MHICKVLSTTLSTQDSFFIFLSLMMPCSFSIMSFKLALHQFVKFCPCTEAQLKSNPIHSFL